ncbi:MAG: type VI secretion system protein TssA [Pseudomonadota bacterium]
MFSADLLLNPISEAQPAGADLAFSPEMDAINLARKFDDPSLDQGEWVTDLKEADWDFVAKRCAALLENKSKDLRVAVWLTEAGAKKYGLRGMAEGFRVLAGLIGRYWEKGLWPESDGADHDQRIGNLSWILARTPTLLREMAVTDGHGKGYSTIDFEAARKQPAGEQNSKGHKLAELDASRKNNSPTFCASFAADARYCMDALLELERAADLRLAQDSPGFSNARDALETMLHLMPPTSAAKPGAAKPAAGTHYYAEPGSAEGAAPAVATPTHAGPPAAPASRTQALAQLRAVAEFFRRTEPHSPVSYFAEKAAAAGEQDLHTWLRSVVKDAVSLSHIEELLGVQPPST